ncbi:type VI secretion system Vgr family protein [Cupriavidus pinatubonensis]|uniref:type VI secretion system Vgr family protein n=1 Tax=Cupriavidus pinatubonensis TaxID=248026 RepID=UPI0011275F01|nr:type VI secretion system Vgr family protein [Cupriavidus pinatubonensis]TPQ40154.1 type VI secretion system tip protein VgrG [Cupriavidus pinatubonensis]
MASVVEEPKATASDLPKGITGRQAYFLEVPSAPTAAALSVVSFKAVERLGEPYVVTVQLTHPLELDRADYLGRDAAFVIDAADGDEPRRFAGCITRFAKTRQTRDFAAYEMVVEPLVARLRLTHASRVYQHKTAPQIIEAILRRHDLKGHQFAFKTRRQYPQHKFRLQYQMSDWDYIRLLMEQEGLYSYFVPGKFGENWVVADDIDHYLYQPELRPPYQETAGLESGVEAVYAIKTVARTVAQSVRAADRNPAQAYERFQAEANIARKDRTTYGQPYFYGTHHLDQDSAKWEAQLRHEAAIAGQVVYEGESNVLELRPARILRLNLALPDAPNGQVITEVTHSGARDQAYRNSFKSIPSDRRFRLPLDEANWPRIAGTLSARVTSPNKYKYAYLTQDGHYTVRFDLDYEEWPSGGESVPLRLAKPFAGGLQTGFHFPLLDGTEVAIAFTDGNPNKPYIAAAHHNSQQGDHITTEDRWLSRNVIRTQSNNKLRMEDWEGQESIKLSTEYGGKTQLNLGYLVDGKKQKRGDGFELRTSGWGAVRGGKGLLISADDQPNAHGQQLDMEAAKGLLQQALQQSEALGAAAKAAEAVAADYARQKALLDESLAQLKRAGILVSAPAGVALASGNDLQCTAAQNLIATAGSHADFSIAKRFTLAAGELVSIFAQKLGVKLVAARGKVELQAQSDEMRLLADKHMTITSANGRVVIEAKDELLLKCGGSYLRMSSTGIEDGTRGDRTIRSAAFSRQGPSSLAQSMNTWQHAKFNDTYVLRNPSTGEPLSNSAIEIARGDGTRLKMQTDASGKTPVQKSIFVEPVQIRPLD